MSSIDMEEDALMKFIRLDIGKYSKITRPLITQMEQKRGCFANRIKLLNTQKGYMCFLFTDGSN